MRFPRVRGDVPSFHLAADQATRFSPRARGCSLFALSLLISGIVFPACAGMFLRWAKYLRLHMCFPRVRGDVPTGAVVTCPLCVFPACAGMFPPHQKPRRRRRGFPRVRGDVPVEYLRDYLPPMFSPRARGCSCPANVCTSLVWVFPACAGMFPAGGLWTLKGLCFPRVRGDVPSSPEYLSPVRVFSPRARGCSAYLVAVPRYGEVFPACAGMFLPLTSTPL